MYKKCVSITFCHVYYRDITCFVYVINSLLFNSLRIEAARVLCYIFYYCLRYFLLIMVSNHTNTNVYFTSDKSILYYFSLITYIQSECGRSYGYLYTNTFTNVSVFMLRSAVILIALDIY